MKFVRALVVVAVGLWIWTSGQSSQADPVKYEAQCTCTGPAECGGGTTYDNSNVPNNRVVFQVPDDLSPDKVQARAKARCKQYLSSNCQTKTTPEGKYECEWTNFSYQTYGELPPEEEEAAAGEEDDSTSGDEAASVLTEAIYIGDSLSYPTEQPDFPTWFYWDHFEDQVNASYQGLCGGTCSPADGKYGPQKASPDDDVNGANGVWGFDGTMPHTDESVLLIEAKATAGTCFPNDATGEQAARGYLAERRQASDKPLMKCGGQNCAQMSALWIESTVKDLCQNGKGDAARQIETAWDNGTLYTTWAAVGFEPSGDSPCLTGWMLEAEAAPPKTGDQSLCPQ